MRKNVPFVTDAFRIFIFISSVHYSLFTRVPVTDHYTRDNVLGNVLKNPPLEISVSIHLLNTKLFFSKIDAYL